LFANQADDVVRSNATENPDATVSSDVVAEVALVEVTLVQ